MRGALATGVLSPAAARQLRACYGAKLTMIDTWLGGVLDVLDRRRLWDSTAVFVCTDHGHYLGEKDVWGKPAVPVFEPLGHIPLLVAWPGAAPRTVDALTTTVDLAATLADLFGVRFAHRTHGRSLLPLIRGETRMVRESVLTGVWGREVHLVTERHKYARAPHGRNEPLSLWSNRWSTMPVHGLPVLRLPLSDDRATLARMPGASAPVLRQPFRAGDMLPLWAWGEFSGNHLYDLAADPGEERNLAGTPAERGAGDALRAALEAVEAPAEQFVRLGLD